MITNQFRILSPLILLFLLLGCTRTDIDEQTPNLDTQTATTRASLPANATHYFWINGQKVPLQINSGKKFIIFDSSLSDHSVVALLKEGIFSRLEEKKPNNYGINMSSKNADHLSERSCILVSHDLAKEADVHNSKGIVYYGESFLFSDGSTGTLSHLFNVKLKQETDIEKLNDLAQIHHVRVIGEDSNLPLWWTLACTEKTDGDALEMANLFYESRLFAESCPDIMPTSKVLASAFNDPYYPSQWHLTNTGQTGGIPAMDINFEKAHVITKGNNAIKIAVFDTGIESHSDLLNVSNLSYDTQNRTSPSVVYDDHGTMCAGLIGARPNNNIGIVGIAPDCPLMSISNQFYEPQLNFGLNLAAGFTWAINNGASVICCAWSGESLLHPALTSAINTALTTGRGGKGCVVVFAAGNSTAYNTSEEVQYPGRINDDILVVGAMTPDGKRKIKNTFDEADVETWSSCYGKKLDVMAPGSGITTTTTYNEISNSFYGTSAACAQVAAIAGLVLSMNNSFTQKQVHDIICKTAKKVGGYTYATISGKNNGTWHSEMGYGLVDAFAATQDIGCTTTEYKNILVSYSRIFSGCKVSMTNITVNQGVTLTVNANEGIEINDKLIVNGSLVLNKM
ncbi:S8 family peptidase [Alistipes timonensis]